MRVRVRRPQRLRGVHGGGADGAGDGRELISSCQQDGGLRVRLAVAGWQGDARGGGGEGTRRRRGVAASETRQGRGRRRTSSGRTRAGRRGGHSPLTNKCDLSSASTRPRIIVRARPCSLSFTQAPCLYLYIPHLRACSAAVPGLRARSRVRVTFDALARDVRVRACPSGYL